MAHSFYASRISDNIGRTPEGYLVCRDSVIARTGKQMYRVSEITRGLDDEVLKDLGLDALPKSESVHLFRDPQEVLDDATLASFEGKPLTNGHPKDPNGVHTENVRELQCGHVQNVRPMQDTLDSGERAVLADLIITDPDLAEKVAAGALREVSCGYTYDLTRDGERLKQSRIRGNHVAVVPSGRAGSEVRIQDAAPPLEEEEEEMNSELLNKLVKAVEQLRDRLPARRAADAEDPENAQEKRDEAEEEEEKEAPEKASDKKAKDARGKDRKKAKDAPAEEEEGKKPQELKDEKKGGYDSKHGEDGARLHAALDRILDEMDKDKEQEAQDTDLGELRKLLDEFFQEEEEEPEHEEDPKEEGDDDPEGNEEAVAEHEIEHTPAEGDAEEEEESPEDGERSDFEEPEEQEFEEDEFDDPDDDGGEERTEDALRQPDPKLGNKKSKAWGYKRHSRTPEDADDAKPSGYRAGAIDALREIRPVIARHGSDKVRAAFNAAYTRINGKSRAGEGSYGKFAAATGRRSRDSKESKQDYFERLNKEAREALMNPGRKKA